MRGVALLLLAAQLMPAQIRKWYEAQEVPEVRDTNTPRVRALIRAGQMHLSLDDAIALAIENNLNLEAARYGPLLADWSLKRAEAGGQWRGRC